MYDLATPTVSTFHSVYLDANSLTNLLGPSSVNSVPAKAPLPTQVTTPTTSTTTYLHQKVRRTSKQVQTDSVVPKSPLTSEPSGAQPPVPLVSTVIPLAPAPPAKQRPPKPVITTATDDPSSYIKKEEEVANSYTTFKAIGKPLGKSKLVYNRGRCRY